MKYLIIIAASLLCLNMALAEREKPFDPEKDRKETLAKIRKGTITFEGGDGSSMEKAIIIKGAKNSMEGVTAERAYFEKHFRGYSKGNQMLISSEDNKTFYDMIVLTHDRTGKEKTIYFDITDFITKNQD